MPKKEIELIPPSYIGAGLYMKDNGYSVAIAVNHHENDVAFIDMVDVDKAIEYLTRFKNRIEKN